MWTDGVDFVYGVATFVLLAEVLFLIYILKSNGGDDDDFA